jgi:large subunit ribosomal protein L15
MSDLSKLSRPDGANQSKKRLGRGPGSGFGKTSGKGHKGQKARTGGKVHSWFEGGQMPLQRRLPKRGFRNPFRVEYEIVNVGAFDDLGVDEITPEVLHQHRLIDLGRGRPVKVLGDGELTRKLNVKAHAFTKGARSKIEAAGGTVEQLEG